MKRTLAALASMASALSLAGMAHAAVYDLTLDHCSGGCGPQSPDFGTVTTSVDSDNIGIDIVVALNNGNSITNTGLHAFTFDLAGLPTVTIAKATSGFTLVTPAPGSYQQDGFGTWPYAIDFSGHGGNNNVPGFSFEILGAGTDLTRFVPVFNNTDKQNVFFTTDIYSGTTGNTGAVGALGAEVPEPATWALMLFGVGAIGAGMRASRRSSTALAAA